VACLGYVANRATEYGVRRLRRPVATQRIKTPDGQMCDPGIPEPKNPKTRKLENATPRQPCQKKTRYSNSNKTPQMVTGESSICEPQPFGLAAGEVLGIKHRVSCEPIIR